LSGRRTGKIVWNRKLWNHRGEIVQQGIFETLVAIKNPPERHSLPKESAAEFSGGSASNIIGSSNGSSGLKSMARTNESR